MEIYDYERWGLHLDSNYISKEIHLVFYCLFSPCTLCRRTIQRLEYFTSGDFQKAVCLVRPISYTDFCNIMSIKGNNWNMLFFKNLPKNTGTTLWSRQTPSNSVELTYRKVVKSSVSGKFYTYSWSQRNLIFAITRARAICCTEDWTLPAHRGWAVGHRCHRVRHRTGGNPLARWEAAPRTDCSCFNNTKLELGWACLLANNHAYKLQRAHFKRKSI